MAKIKADLKAGRAQLPPADPMLLKLQALQSDPGLGAEAVHQMVQQSPTLGARALGVANSAYYGGARKVSNLKDALRRLGNRRVLSLAQSVIHQRFYVARAAAMTDLLTANWMQTIFVATLTRELARDRIAMHAEDCYLAALMHNIGEVLLVRLVAEQWGETTIDEEDLRALSEGCRRYHQDLGQALLQAWRLPDACVRLAGRHHSTKTAGMAPVGAEDRKLLLLTGLASHACARLYMRCAVTELPDIDPAKAMEELEVGRPDLGAAVARSRDLCDAIMRRD